MTASPRSRFVLAAGLALMLMAAPAFADYRESFRRGVIAYRAQNWAATVALMRAALQERASEEGRVQISGNDPVPYLPSYFLGDALMRLGDCAGAMEAFDRARQTAAVNNRQWSTRMDEVREACGKTVANNRSAEAATAVQAAAGAIAEARAVRERIDRYKDREFGAEALAGFNSELAGASGTLANAELRLGQAKQGNDAPSAREVERQARTVAKDLGSLESRLQEQIRRLTENAAVKPTIPPPNPPPPNPGKDPGGKDPVPSGDALLRLQNAARVAGNALRLAQQAEASYEASRGGTIDTPALQEARAELNRVAETVNRGTRASETELMNAVTSANRVRDSFARARDTALSRDLTEAAQAVERLLISAAGNLGTLEKLAQPIGGRPAALDAQALTPHQRELARLRASLTGGAAKDPGALRRTLGSATSLDQTLGELVARYGQQVTAARGVPADLLEGARTYFAGRYVDAASQLEAVQLAPDSPSSVRLQMHLLRAAAAFAVWAVSGERDDARRQLAALEVAECRRIDPGFTPDAAVFSPRFIRFFRDAR